MKVLRNKHFPHLAVNIDHPTTIQLCDNCNVIKPIPPTADFEAEANKFVNAHKNCPTREDALTLNELLL